MQRAKRSLTEGILHRKYGIHCLSLASLAVHILLKEHSAKGLAVTPASWSQNIHIC